MDDGRDLGQGTRSTELRDRIVAHELIGGHTEPGGERGQAVDVGLTTLREAGQRRGADARFRGDILPSQPPRAPLGVHRSAQGRDIKAIGTIIHLISLLKLLVTGHILHISKLTPNLKEVQSMASDQEMKKVGNDEKVEVTVNDKPVVLDSTKQTGASIKKAAIEQDVNIKEDFVLSIELGGGKTKLVGDDEKIDVYAGERFLAIENDDNS